MRYLIVIAAVLAVAGCTGRNVPRQDRVEEVKAGVKALQELGVSGKFVLIWGNGHVAGQAFNITGSSGFAEIVLPPSEKETE